MLEHTRKQVFRIFTVQVSNFFTELAKKAANEQIKIKQKKE